MFIYTVHSLTASNKREKPPNRNTTHTIYSIRALAADWQVTISRRSPTRHAIPTQARIQFTHVYYIPVVHSFLSCLQLFENLKNRVFHFLIVFTFRNNSVTRLSPAILLRTRHLRHQTTSCGNYKTVTRKNIE